MLTLEPEDPERRAIEEDAAWQEYEARRQFADQLAKIKQDTRQKLEALERQRKGGK
jgi:hypothetical protein